MYSTIYARKSDIFTVSLIDFFHVKLLLDNYSSKKIVLPRPLITRNFKILFHSTERIPSKINIFRSNYTFYKTLIKILLNQNCHTETKWLLSGAGVSSFRVALDNIKCNKICIQKPRPC